MFATSPAVYPTKPLQDLHERLQSPAVEQKAPAEDVDTKHKQIPIRGIYAK